MMEERWPWEAEESLEASDPLAHQRHEQAVKERLPRVVKLLPVQGTVMGSSSPHQTGDIVCYDILKRAPVYDLTSHFSDIQPHAPARGAHRHISAPIPCSVSAVEVGKSTTARLIRSAPTICWWFRRSRFISTAEMRMPVARSSYRKAGCSA
jgi:hypothetical protein